jgi:hypothetical protein
MVKSLLVVPAPSSEDGLVLGAAVVAGTAGCVVAAACVDAADVRSAVVGGATFVAEEHPVTIAAVAKSATVDMNWLVRIAFSQTKR